MGNSERLSTSSSAGTRPSVEVAGTFTGRESRIQSPSEITRTSGETTGTLPWRFRRLKGIFRSNTGRESRIQSTSGEITFGDDPQQGVALGSGFDVARPGILFEAVQGDGGLTSPVGVGGEVVGRLALATKVKQGLEIVKAALAKEAARVAIVAEAKAAKKSIRALKMHAVAREATETADPKTVEVVNAVAKEKKAYEVAMRALEKAEEAARVAIVAEAKAAKARPATATAEAKAVEAARAEAKAAKAVEAARARREEHGYLDDSDAEEY